MRIRRYWLVEHLSISRIIRGAPAQYSRAFLFTETDERDVTYFIVHQLEVIERAVDQLHTYLSKQIDDVREVERLLRGSNHFNHRQLALLGHALRAPDARYSFQGHATSHGVTHETARNDLIPLAKMGFLEQRRDGPRYSFAPPVNLSTRLKALS
jgi:Fic family protein